MFLSMADAPYPHPCPHPHTLALTLHTPLSCPPTPPQALYDICLAVREAHPLMWRAGTCQALLSLISKPAEVVNFHRDRAAVILAHLAAQELPKRWIKVRGAGGGGVCEGWAVKWIKLGGVGGSVWQWVGGWVGGWNGGPG